MGLRVAVIGAGPKGLYALERLFHHAQAGAAELSVDVFEPHPAAGAGPVYDPSQPDYLRMNLAAESVDMWSPQSRAVPGWAQRSFVGWCGPVGPARFPPRAQVGRYLAEGFALLCEHAPAGITVTLRAVAVRRLEPAGAGWTVLAANGVARGYDEVLLATGHRAARPGPHGRPVFPVDQHLSAEHIPAGAAVAVRGFALTFIDAALALTEGRGGRFTATTHPYRLRYVGGGAQAGPILPFSRSGRPMPAKADPPLTAAARQTLAKILGDGRERIAALPHGVALQDDLVPLIAAAAAAALRAVGGDRSAAPLVMLRQACAGRALDSELGVAAELERSLAIDAGLQRPDLSWALGSCWRGLYPALVARLGHDGLADADWPAFRRLAAGMERVAFGPPPVNAAKLLALLAAGRVDLAHARGGWLEHRGGATILRSAGGVHRVDAVVDAVLPGPGVRADDSLIAALLAAGYARVRPGRRGLDIAGDAGCIGRDGTITAGLAAVGRPTEDAVIGNDTLTRAMHPHDDCWARRVVARAHDRTATRARAAA